MHFAGVVFFVGGGGFCFFFFFTNRRQDSTSQKIMTCVIAIFALLQWPGTKPAMCLRWTCVVTAAFQRGRVVRDASLCDFVVVRMSGRVLTQSRGLAFAPGLQAPAARSCSKQQEIKSNTRGNDAIKSYGKHSARGCCRHTPPSKL